MDRLRKTLWSLVVIAALGGVAAFGVFSAFSDTTTNTGNQFAAGTVAIGNNATSPLYDVSNAKPGVASTDHCIKITYSGSLAATVKVYRSSLSGSLGPYLNLTVTKGTGDQENCSDFTPAATGSGVYSGTLSAFATDWSTGLALTNASGSSAWSNTNAVTYKFSAQVADDNAAKGLSTGTHTFTWEAQNN